MKNTPYIVIDGLDCCGKSTQIMLFAERARDKEGRQFHVTKEPGGDPLATEIRWLFKSELGMGASAITQLFMMFGARRSYLEKTVWPSLEKGIPIISDRGDSSSLAYQVYAMQEPGLESFFWRSRDLVFAEHEPSLYVIVDVPAAVARDRSMARASESTFPSDFDKKPVEWFERVREGFAAFAKALPDKVVIVDGNRPPEEVQKDFYRIVSEACGW